MSDNPWAVCITALETADAIWDAEPVEKNMAAYIAAYTTAYETFNDCDLEEGE